MEPKLRYITLAFIALIAISTLAMLPVHAMNSRVANAVVVKEVKTSRDAWGTIYFNQTFYVDIVLDITSEIPGTTLQVAMIYGSTTYQLNATRVGTTYTYRIWFWVAANGTLYAYESNPDGTKSNTKETIQPAITLEEGDTLTFVAYGKQASLTVSAQTPSVSPTVSEVLASASTLSLVNWKIKAPDLNYDPLAKDTYTLSVTYYKEGAASSAQTASITVEELGANEGEFNVTSGTLNLTPLGLSAGDTLVINITVPKYSGASETYTVQAKLSVVSVPTITITTDRKEIPLSASKEGVVLYINVTDYSMQANTGDLYLTLYARNGTAMNISGFFVGASYVSNATYKITLSRIEDSIFGGYVKLNTSLLNSPIYIGGWVELNWSKSISKLYLKVYPAKLETNASSVKYGDVVEVKLYDPEMNLNTTAKDTVTLCVSGANEKNVTLTETGPNTGIFMADLVIGKDITGVDPGSSFSICYTDERSPRTPETAPSFLSDSYSLTYTVLSFTGSVSTSKAVYGPYETVKIIIKDWDANRDPTAKDQINKDKIFIVIGAKQTHPGSNAVETDVNTGTFEVEITPEDLYKAATNSAPASIKDAAKYLLQAGKILVMYADDYTPEGPKVLQTSFKFESYDPKIMTDKKAYNIGDKMNITIVDPDANVDSSTIDSITVILKSTSYPVGTEVTLYETDVDTGVFTGTVIVSDTQIGPGYIYAKFGDIITIEYTDDLPADFASTGKAKTFTYTVRVGVVIPKPIKPQTPAFVEPTTGTPVTPKVGKSVMIKVPLTNVGTLKQTFTVVLIIRDSSGAAIYISMASLPLGGGETGEVGFTYTPTAPGTYTVEVYIIKSLADWTPLGESLTATMTVSE